MTVIKKDDKTGKYYFVYSGGVHPITGARIQKRRQGMSSLREAKEVLKQVIIEVDKEKILITLIKACLVPSLKNGLNRKRLDFDQVQSSITASSLITTYFHI